MGGNTGKIVMVVVLLAVAGTVIYLTNRPVEVKEPEVTTRDMVCLDSGKHFVLSSEEYSERLEAAPDPEEEAQSGPRRRTGSRRQKLIPCDECDGGDALLAAKCQDSDAWYPVINPDGSRGQCGD